ncbi:transcriptional regulator [Bradyrhizobium agreste]|nr:transcriptional regulator [Bradyrhizobium agreste]
MSEQANRQGIVSFPADRDARRAMQPERQHQNWRSEAGSRLWLTGLIAAMKHAERPEVRRQPVAPEILRELRAQLALTASFRTSGVSTLRH